MIRCVIVEDEEIARKVLKSLLAQYCQAISQHFSHPLEIEVTIDPKENKSPQQKRKNDLQYLLEYLFSFSSFQNRRFFKLHCLYLHDAKILS